MVIIGNNNYHMVLKHTKAQKWVSLPANQFDHILGPTSKIKILRFLTTAIPELNGREIANAVGISHVNAHVALKELSQYGIVVMHRAGKSILYSLNLNNLLVKRILIPFFEKEARLGRMIGEILSKNLKKPFPRSVILFGSYALGLASPTSDIDVLVIASKKKDIPFLNAGLKKAEITIIIGFDKQLAPLVMDEDEFRKRFKNNNKLIRNIVREGVVLSGLTINDLIKAND